MLTIGLPRRNLVTSLFEHGRISTTVAKAKETAREAEKVITLGKKGTNASHSRAQAFLFVSLACDKRSRRPWTKMTDPLPTTYQSTGASLAQLKTLAERYAERPGGYTRLHLHGNRQGDHAPRAILELVDNPRDLRLEMTARAIARETLRTGFGRNTELTDYSNGKPFSSADFTEDGLLRFAELTARNITKVTRFGGEEAMARLASQANAAMLWQRAEKSVAGERRVDEARIASFEENRPRGSTLKGAVFTRPYLGKKPLAGEEELGSTGSVTTPRLRTKKGIEKKHSVVRIAKGVFAKRPRGKTTAVSPAQEAMLASGSRGSGASRARW